MTTHDHITRRALLRTAGLAGTFAVLGGCSAAEGFRLRQDVEDRPRDELLLTVWASTQEEAAFRALAESFTAENRGSVQLQVVPFSQALTTVDTGLRTGAPPDVFRVTYSDAGPYRAQGVLAQLPDDVASRLEPQFGSSFWSAVTDDAGTFGVPHHTDTTMILLDDEALAAAGVRDVPGSPEDAWSWQELLDVARRLQAAADRGQSSMAVNWQLAGASRWLTWVDQAGGRLVAPGGRSAVAADDPSLRAAVAFTRGLFDEGLVPLSMSTKSGQYTEGLFSGRQVAMAYVGNFTLPTIADTVGFGWTPTFLQQDVRASADLGGNALVAVDGPRTELAHAFMEHCVGQQQQADFCAAANALPTRTDLPPGSITYPVEPGAMALYAQQADAITPQVAEQYTVPAATGLNRVLVEQLEAAFLGDRSVPDAEVCRNLVTAVDAELSR